MKRNRPGRPPHPDVLTPAEWRVLEALRDGSTNAEIAARLGISRDTVKYHVSNMLAKLALDDRRALAAWRPDQGRGRVRGLFALPAAVESLGRSVVTVGVGVAAVTGVVVAVVAAVAVVAVVLVAGDGNGDFATLRPPDASTPQPSPSSIAPTPTATATAPPTASATPVASTPTATPPPTPTPAPTVSPTLEPTPRPIATPPPGRYIDIEAGHRSACALTDEGEVVCWGDLVEGHPEVLPGRYQQIISTTWSDHDPTLGSRGWRDYGACALTEDGEVTCWNAALGMTKVGPDGPFTVVSSSGEHMCALTGEGEPMCWGSEQHGLNWHGELDVPEGRFTAISAGANSFNGPTRASCALDEAGAIACWGSSHQVDNVPAGSYTTVVTTGSHHCALEESGELNCWDWNGSAANTPGDRFQAVDTSGEHSCALTLAGEAVCWERWNTVLIPPDPPLGRYTAISVGGGYACALTAAGEAECWETVVPLVARPDRVPGSCTAPTDPTCVVAVYPGAPDDYVQVADIPADRLLTRTSDGRYHVERGQQYTVVTAAPLPAGWTRFSLERDQSAISDVPSPVSAEQLVLPIGTAYTFTVGEDPDAPGQFTYALTAARPHPTRPTQEPELGDVVVTTVFQAPKFTYNRFDSTGTATAAGSYALLMPDTDSETEGATTPVTTYDELRSSATTLVVNAMDGDGFDQSTYLDAVQVGDVLEWRQERDCFTRYRVMSTPAPADGAQVRRFGVEWHMYSFVGCGGTVRTDAKTRISLDLGPHRITNNPEPIRYGPWQLHGSSWRGALEAAPLSTPADDTSTQEYPYSSDLAVVKQHRLWRGPDLPDGWVLQSAEQGNDNIDGYSASYSRVGHAAIQLWILEVHATPWRIRLPDDGRMSVVETRYIDGLTAYVEHTSADPRYYPTLVHAHDASTNISYLLLGYSLDIDQLIGIARSLWAFE